MPGLTSIVLNPGAGGASLGVDSDGTADYQVMKLGYSIAGSTPVQVSGTNPLPCDMTTVAGTATASGTGTTTAGTQRVVIATDQPTMSNAQPVLQSGAWSVTANIGTTNGLALDATVSKLTLAQGSTTAAQTGPLMQGAVTTAAPSYTTAQTSPLSLTLAGALRVDGSAVTQPISGTVTANQGGAPWSANITQIGGSALALGQTTMASSIPVTLASNQSALSISGTVTANIGTTNGLALDASVTGLQVAQGSTTSGQKGGLVLGAVTTAAPSYTTAQSSPLSLTTAGALRVDGSAVTQPVSGTVTANIGTTNGLALDTSVNGLLVAQGSTTSGEKGPMIQGAVTTAAPSYTTAQTSPLSLTTAGALRVDGSAVTQPVSGTVTTSPPANASTNVAQFGGTNVATGTGAGGAGIPRVTVSNDTELQLWDGTNGPVAVKAASTAAVAADKALVVAVSPNNTVAVTESGTWTVQPGNTANTTPWLVTDTPSTSGGLSFNSFVGAASNNLTQIKSTAGQLYLISVQNIAGTPVYLKVFNKTSANVTMGTTACDYQFIIPGNTAGAGVVLNVDKGIAMGTAITVALTAGISTTDNTSTVANQQVVTVGYK